MFSWQVDGNSGTWLKYKVGVKAGCDGGYQRNIQ